MKYGFVKAQLQSYPLSMSGATLGVAVSGYHAWQERPPAPRTLEAQRLLFLIKTFHQQSGETYVRRVFTPSSESSTSTRAV